MSVEESEATGQPMAPDGVSVTARADQRLKRIYDFTSLAKLALSYYSAADQAYSSNPESRSILLLTIMELWVLCDKAACELYPLLQDYSTGFRPCILDSLILPKREQLDRLAKVGDYLAVRRKLATMGPPWEWKSFGWVSRQSFAVRYYNSSPQHKSLHRKIIERATTARDAKWKELESRKSEYDLLMQEYHNTRHQYKMTRNSWGEWVSKDSPGCTKCIAHSKAMCMRIDVFEWPLPENDIAARATVFELQVPDVIKLWRITTLTILLVVLQNAFPDRIESTSLYYPISHPIIKDTIEAEPFADRATLLGEATEPSADGESFSIYFPFRLASGTLPSKSSQGYSRSVNEANAGNICTKHGYVYEFYNTHTGRTVSESLSSWQLSANYSYPPDTVPEPLKRWILGTSHSQNGVIAKQMSCPTTMSFDEFKAFGTLRGEVSLQWRNILFQLIHPTLNLNKPETLFLILQAANEAGPKSRPSALRDTHEILDDEEFGRALLGGLNDALSRIRENWESDIALCIFLSIATRLLSVSNSKLIQNQCITYLADIRLLSINWTRILLKKLSNSNKIDERQDLNRRTLMMALICHGTFDIGPSHLPRVLSNDTVSSLLFESCIIVAEHTSSHTTSTDPILTILLHRWRRLSYEVEDLLRNKIVNVGGTGLDLAIQSIWAAYCPPAMPWCSVAKPHQHLVVVDSGSTPGQEALRLQYNLLTGGLLVNGAPMSTLPPSFMSHKTYKRLFKDRIINVMPSAMCGMRFSGTNLHHGHEVHFALMHGELVIRTRKGGKTYELIPDEKLQNDFPSLLVSDYAHWLVEGDNRIEFRPLDHPWGTPELNLNFQEDGTARLAKSSSHMFIDIRSKTAKALSKIFRPFEQDSFIHLTYDRAQLSLLIELPRFGIQFSLRCGDAFIKSNHYRGYIIDDDQTLGTLSGLESKLVLRGQNQLPGMCSRAVIVPQGQVSFEKGPVGHASTRIITGDGKHVQHHFFQVDTVLGRLRDSGTMQSKLLLCYLHAVTSHCLPDKLTGRTGTEEALRIINSSAVRSFNRLREEDADLLRQIGHVSPSRNFHAWKKSHIQTIVWSDLSALAQHDGFYEAVQSILMQAQKCEIFFPENIKEIKFLKHSQSYLIDRQSIRTSPYRQSQFGAEQYTTRHDMEYAERGRLETSEAGLRTYRLVKCLQKGKSGHLMESISPSIRQTINRIVGCRTDESQEELYDSTEWPAQYSQSKSYKLVTGFHFGWLQHPSVALRNSWCDVHKRLSQNDRSRDKYRLMMFFAGLSFAEEADPQVIQILLAFATDPRVRAIPSPQFSLSLSDGALPDEIKLRGVAEECALSFSSNTEAQLQQDFWESSSRFNSRREEAYNKSVSNAVNSFINELKKQWPCRSPRTPSSKPYGKYLSVQSLMRKVEPMFRSWYDNRIYQTYLENAIDILCTQPVLPKVQGSYITPKPTWKDSVKAFIGVEELFFQSPPSVSAPESKTFMQYFVQNNDQNYDQPEIQELLDDLDRLCQSGHKYRRHYVVELRQSFKKLKHGNRDPSSIYMNTSKKKMAKILMAYFQTCQRLVNEVYEKICTTLSPVQAGSEKKSGVFTMWPRVTPILLLEQLSRRRWQVLSESWRHCLVQYALSLTVLQRAERLVKTANRGNDLIKELTNIGHTNWDPMQYPDSLLFEIENSILIRHVQEQIASEMRSLPSAQSAVMQLNMGEGKSSVIVPIVAAALADGKKLVRIIVTKSLSKQMMHTLTMKLGGLLDRRVFYLPISRQLRRGLGSSVAENILERCKMCMEIGGVLLVQPEHILSFKLLGLESVISGDVSVGRALTTAQHFLDNFSRDLVDESDEIFSVKFELTYSMGSQTALEFSPQRWQVVQNVLTLVGKVAKGIHQRDPNLLEFDSRHSGGFPRTRILHGSVVPVLMEEVGRRICETGLERFSNISRQAPDLRRAIFKYITKPDLTDAEILDVERSFYSESTCQPLLLLRGLIAGGIVVFVLQQKRWRVDYGLDYNRHPPTRLAVPYIAKDSPSPHSEFSHPEVVIALTCLSYYYGGLKDDELFVLFEHLLRSEHGDIEYTTWIQFDSEIPTPLRHLSGVNIKDRTQCVEKVFPHFRYVKAVIDYYLSEILFPREVGEFTKKLCASGWDIGKKKGHPTTGFSGTNDSKYVLPLSIGHLDLPQQKHTNASVLNCLLRPENSVREITLESTTNHGCRSTTDFLLHIVANSKPRIQVILDVGAQILEYGNLDVARIWLEMVPRAEAEVAIFFNENDELTVVTRDGLIESFATSPYVTHMASCLVFLDETHTRGTDLRLPDDCRAAVMLGPNLTKDRLVQACMRMRRLGRGQSIVFFVPNEIRQKIAALCNIPAGRQVRKVDLLSWSIQQTWEESLRNVRLWAGQGIRHHRQEEIWLQARDDMRPEIAIKYLEDESQPLEKRYRPSNGGGKDILHDETDNLALIDPRDNLVLIRTRCEEFGVFTLSDSTLHGEQERELSPEVEKEREIQKPSGMTPYSPSIHPAVIHLVRTGEIRPSSGGFRPAFMAFQNSSAAGLIDLSQFPSDILVTEDFARTVWPGTPPYVSDQYHRPVQWIVTSSKGSRRDGEIKHMVVFSPWEVNKVLPDIRKRGAVTLHLYGPQPNLTFRSLEDLTLYTTPPLPPGWTAPRSGIVQLNLFAGQLYLRSYAEYTKLCDFLGLSYHANNSSETNIDPDGFVGRSLANANCAFTKSPIPFLRVLMTKICRDCRDISKTDIGRILAGQVLTEEDFKGRDF
ncbi:hypothetical protein BDZ45DRAFT_671975 [Acephala macrosclerotiorum]|nr:hypothetical protein BDZ45DRAFT_671975 [Acephala macrosclerotiorum]